MLGPGSEYAHVDFPAKEILRASPEGWRLIEWQGWDEDAQRRRVFPAEIFGPLPAP
ncbi:MAG: hypothetical protein AAF191_19540 [Verrucomicrobiota bacterium]